MRSVKLLTALTVSVLLVTGLAMASLNHLQTALDEAPDTDQRGATYTDGVIPPLPRLLPANPELAAYETQAAADEARAYADSLSGGGLDPAAPETDIDARRIIHRVCRVTAYCDRGTTAAGTQAGVGQCAAPGDIPFGTVVYIPALDRTFVVTDRTHKRFRKSTVDLFVPGCRDAKEFGLNFFEVVFVLPEDQ